MKNTEKMAQILRNEILLVFDINADKFTYKADSLGFIMEFIAYNYFIIKILYANGQINEKIKFMETKCEEIEMHNWVILLDDEIRLRIPDKYLTAREFNNKYTLRLENNKVIVLDDNGEKISELENSDKIKIHYLQGNIKYGMSIIVSLLDENNEWVNKIVVWNGEKFDILGNAKLRNI